MNARETLELGIIVLYAVVAVVFSAMWFIPYIVEKIASSRFDREAPALAAAEAAWWAEYKRTGVWPTAESTPRRSWRPSAVLARLRARNAAVLDERERQANR